MKKIKMMMFSLFLISLCATSAWAGTETANSAAVSDVTVSAGNTLLVNDFSSEGNRTFVRNMLPISVIPGEEAAKLYEKWGQAWNLRNLPYAQFADAKPGRRQKLIIRFTKRDPHINIPDLTPAKIIERVGELIDNLSELAPDIKLYRRPPKGYLVADDSFTMSSEYSVTHGAAFGEAWCKSLGADQFDIISVGQSQVPTTHSVSIGGSAGMGGLFGADEVMVSSGGAGTHSGTSRVVNNPRISMNINCWLSRENVVAGDEMKIPFLENAPQTIRLEPRVATPPQTKKAPQTQTQTQTPKETPAPTVRIEQKEADTEYPKNPTGIYNIVTPAGTGVVY